MERDDKFSGAGTPSGRCGPLPRGRRLPREQVLASQRRRLVEGVAAALVDGGCSGITVKRVIEAAGVSRSTFYEHFDNAAAALAGAHAETAERLTEAISGRCRPERRWAARVDAAIGATLEFAAAEPALTRLLTLEAAAFEPALAPAVLAVHGRFAAMLAGGREHSRAGSPPPIAEAFLVGGISRTIARGLAMNEAELLPELREPLVELVTGLVQNDFR